MIMISRSPARSFPSLAVLPSERVPAIHCPALNSVFPPVRHASVLSATGFVFLLLTWQPAVAAAGPAVEGGSESRSRRIDFIRDVSPVLSKAGCNGGKCHGSFQGRGGFRLSLFGFDPAADHEAITAHARGRRVSLTAPDASLLLQKPLGEVPHGGGRRFGRDDALYQTLRQWIAQGAGKPADAALTVSSIVVEPAAIVVAAEQSQSLKVTATWSDGVVQDVTRLTVYESRDESRVEVSPAGSVLALRPGRSAVTVSFMGQVSAVTVTSPYAEEAVPFDFVPQNFVDGLVAKEWRAVGLVPAPLCDDATFVRRVYLDLIGTLPTPVEVRGFVASTETGKRVALIDSLLGRQEYVDHWAHKWADLLRVHRRYVGDKGLWSFWGWVQNVVRENWPVDRVARELITARGSLFSNGATAYYFTDTKPDDLAETTAQLFLGVRLQCARCHHHPYEVWSQEDYYGLASFFTRLELKDNGDNARFGGAKLLRPVAQVQKDRRIAMDVPPALFGKAAETEGVDDVRVQLADWITSPDNAFFTRSFVNRYWSYLMGRGLVEPVDDFRATNPPTHPELLDALNADFVAHGLDVKHLLRTICNSRVYQLESVVAPQRDQDGTFYTHRRFSRLSAAVLLDAVDQVCGTHETFPGMPAGTRAQQLPDPQIPSYFLDAFGRSVRSSPCECATSESPDLAQALHLINSVNLNGKISAPDGRLAAALKSDRSDAEIVTELYLTALAREPRPQELEIAIRLVSESDSREAGFEDLTWTLLNSTAFLFNH
ncbi:DUF1553 domain-containing protein [bacterium]|nr:DUF1553 domain-containing protein [bacterium]